MPLVLMYHSVEPYDDDPYQVTVQPASGSSGSCGGCAGAGCAACRCANCCRPPRRRGRGLVGLTFDDGYADFVTEVHAGPAALRLHRDGVRRSPARSAATTPGTQPGPRKPLMTADDVRRAADAGIEIGSHSLTPPAG